MQHITTNFEIEKLLENTYTQEGISEIHFGCFKEEITPDGISFISAIRYRLCNPQNPLFLCSFRSCDALLHTASRSLLMLDGTYFLRLPVGQEEATALILEKKEIPLPTLKTNTFIEKCCKESLLEIIRRMNHGQERSLVNQLLTPLWLRIHSYTGAADNQIQAIVLNYLNHPEIKDLLFYTRCIPDGTTDLWLTEVKEMGNLLSSLQLMLNNIFENQKKYKFVLDELYSLSEKLNIS